MYKLQNRICIKSSQKSIFLFCFFTAFLVIAVCSKSSFLYPLNDWVDSNCFFTVGKSMLHGKILYKDLIEQKGPWLYFFHAIAYCISNTTFIGVYVLEVVAASFFLFYSYQILSLYLSNAPVALIPMIALLVYTSRSFCHGDSVEELCLPFFAFTMFHLLKFMKHKDTGSRVTWIVNGFFCGVIFFSKFTIAGFYFGFCLILAFLLLIDKQFALFFKYFLGFTVGFSVALLPWILYFTVNHALADFFQIYFYNNIFNYGTVNTIASMLKNVFFSTAVSFRNNLQYSLPLVVGLLVFAFSKSIHKKEKLALFALFTITSFFIYGGGKRYPYYGLVLAIFFIPAFAMIISTIEKITEQFFHFIKVPKFKFLTTFALLVMVILSYFMSQNTYLMKVAKKDMPQYQLASVIHAKKDATLLNYGFLDGGFYTTTNIIPNCKIFCNLNTNVGKQSTYVENHATTFIVTRFHGDKDKKEAFFAENGYQLVATSSALYFEGLEYQYNLYELAAR